MCARCKSTLPAHGSDPRLCTYCSTLTRIEFERGFVQLESYLAKWAAFDRWLMAHA
jgi:hypothetical protein